MRPAVSRPMALAAGAAGVALCLLLGGQVSRAQQAPGAPTITSASPPVHDSLLVSWSAPASNGGSAIVAYDLRHIASNASDKSDPANWATIDNAWTTGALSHTITGLDANVKYDLQVRAVNANGEGAWSATFEASTDCANSVTSFGDPRYGCQWHLNNPGFFPDGAMQDIGIEGVWDTSDLTTMGQGINIAVVDDGLHSAHEDLTDNVDTSRNYAYNTMGTDVYGRSHNHGTAVAGVIAARDNSLGVRGVAPRAKIYAYNLAYAGNSTEDNQADAMTRNMADTAVVNNSWGFFDTGNVYDASAVFLAAVVNGATNGMGGKGVSYVYSAGNGGDRGDHSNLDGRTNHYTSITVCAVRYDDVRSSYSEQGANLWVCAPSDEDDEGSTLPGITTTDNDNKYSEFGGTSAAAPIVSGVVALLRAANSELTWRDVKLILANTARKNDPTNSGWLMGETKYGSTSERYAFNIEYGFGVVDAEAAVTAAKSWTNLPPMRTVSGDSTGASLDIPDAVGDTPGATVESTLTIGGDVPFAEFVEINLDLKHSYVRDLDIELVAPSGRRSTLSVPGRVTHALGVDRKIRFGSARHLGEDSAGTWTLRITDHSEGDTGTLRSWSLKAFGHGGTTNPPTTPRVNSDPANPTTLSVSWRAPDTAVNQPIISYDLRYRVQGSTGTWSNGPQEVTGTSTTISGLSANTAYEVQARATSRYGDSGWSASGHGEAGDRPSRVIVGNTAQANEFTDNGNLSTHSIFQRFTTGSNRDGYRVTSVDIMFLTVAEGRETTVPHIGIYRHRGNGLPGTRVGALFTRPARLVAANSGINTWTNAGVDLDPNTTYVLGVISGGDAAHVVRNSSSGAEDGGGLPGWSVQDDHNRRARGGSSYSPVSKSLKMRLYGYADPGNPPVFASAGYVRSVDENTGPGQNVGAPITATDADNDPLTYSLGGRDAAAFTVDASSGQILTRGGVTYDHEGQNSYSLTISATDGLSTATARVTVDLNDVFEPTDDPCHATPIEQGRTPGRLTRECYASRRAHGAYREYSFTLAQPTRVMIVVESDLAGPETRTVYGPGGTEIRRRRNRGEQFDPYLILVRTYEADGRTHEAETWEVDDIDGSVGNRSAGLIKDLQAGDYIIHATSYSQGVLDVGFTLTYLHEGPGQTLSLPGRRSQIPYVDYDAFRPGSGGVDDTPDPPDLPDDPDLPDPPDLPDDPDLPDPPRRPRPAARRRHLGRRLLARRRLRSAHLQPQHQRRRRGRQLRPAHLHRRRRGQLRLAQLRLRRRLRRRLGLRLVLVLRRLAARAACVYTSPGTWQLSMSLRRAKPSMRSV